MLKIGIVAGEPSGDQLAAPLLAELRQYFPGCEIEGIGGPLMQAQGCSSLYPMERLSVMGLVEVLGRYRELRHMRSELSRHFLENPPDVFIGVDAPDFNLGLEKQLRSAGIKTVHYVSPSVWAWKKWRLRLIKKSVDLMLTLFPFEEAYYRQHDIAVCTVGHTLADDIPLESDQQPARQQLSIPPEAVVLGLLPGSRNSEWQTIGPEFFKCINWLVEKLPSLHVVVPLVNDRAARILKPMAQMYAPDANIVFTEGLSRVVMQAADSVLLASGTAALEAMLIKRPMVIAYKMHPLSYHIIHFMTRKLRWYSLPNLLADKQLVPELIQDQVRVDVIGPLVLQQLTSQQMSDTVNAEFQRLHLSLQRNASQQAAKAIIGLIADKQPQSAS